MGLNGVCAILGTALVLAPRPAHAEVDRVALVALPHNLEGAVRTALDPWHIEIVPVTNPVPGASMPSAADRATEIAGTTRAGAVVWLAKDDAGEALWIFDAESGRTTSRRLATAQPFDDLTAAAVALTVKTLLRFSAVAPATERYVTVIERPVRELPSRFALAAQVGFRWRHTGVSNFEARLGLGVRLRLPVAGDHLVALGSVRLGPGVAIDEPLFVGHFSDLEAGAGAAWEQPLGPRFALAAQVGVALHFTEIDGSLPAAGTAARARRVNPAVSAGLTWMVHVGRRLDLGAEVEGSYSLRRQRYLVAGDPVLDLPAGELEGRLIAVLPIE